MLASVSDCCIVERLSSSFSFSNAWICSRQAHTGRKQAVRFRSHTKLQESAEHVEDENACLWALAR